MSNQMAQRDGDGRRRFEEFLLHEYDNIAQAHFNTINTISTFFRYYLLIVALPVPLVALLTKPSGSSADGLLDAKLGVLIPALGTVIALVGLCVMGYTAHLRTTATLYARTVNGIRDYFTRTGDLAPDEEARTRVLPRTTDQPAYREWFSFGFMILAFILVDVSYFAAGWFWWLVETSRDGCLTRLVLCVCSAVLVLAHVATYECLVRRRSKQYPGSR